jgi:hypothetical protein
MPQSIVTEIRRNTRPNKPVQATGVQITDWNIKPYTTTTP